MAYKNLYLNQPNNPYVFAKDAQTIPQEIEPVTTPTSYGAPPKDPNVEPDVNEVVIPSGVIGAPAPSSDRLDIKNANEQADLDKSELDVTANTWRDQYRQRLADEQLYKTNQQYIQDLADMAERPLSQQEMAKRERSAAAIGGIGALGNVANAFSNLIFTGQGAPSQTLPQNPDFGKAIDDLREENRKKAKNYLANSAARLAAMRAEREYKDTQALSNAKLKLSQQQASQEYAMNMAKIRYYEAQGDTEKANALKAQNEAIIKAAEAKTAEAMQEQKLANEKAKGGLIAAQTNSAYASAESSRASAANSWASAAKSTNENYKTILKSDGSTINIPKTAWNEANLGAILTAAGEPLTETTQTVDITGIPRTVTKKRDLESMARRIGYIMQNGTPDQVARMEQKLNNLNGESNKSRKASSTSTSSSSTSSTKKVSKKAPYLSK